MNKRTYSSVTNVQCTCGVLGELSKEPENPIKFDAALNEFHIEYLTPQGKKVAIVIYHCTFCGGTLPESRRDKLSKTIPESERQRLSQLIEGVNSIDDAFRAFGVPDFDDIISTEGVVVNSEENNGDLSRENERSLTYQRLSEYADVHINSSPGGVARILVVPKKIDAEKS